MRRIYRFALFCLSLLTFTTSAHAQTNLTWTDSQTGISYTFIVGSYDNNKALLESQPWWGDSNAALDIVNRIGIGLGVNPYHIPGQNSITDFGSVTAWRNADFGSGPIGPCAFCPRPADATVDTAVRIFGSTDLATNQYTDFGNNFSVIGWIRRSEIGKYVVTSQSLQPVSAPEIDGTQLPSALFCVFVLIIALRLRRSGQFEGVASS